MSDELNEIPEAPPSFDAQPAKKSNKTLWIILAVVAVVILCCCLVTVVVGVVAYRNGAFDTYYYYLPGMLLALA